MSEHKLTQLPEGHFRCDDCGLFFATGSEHTWFAKSEELQAENERLKKAYYATVRDVEQYLGKALGYPWFKDDQKNFPGATEKDGVCVGGHVAESIASEAAGRIKKLQTDNERLRTVIGEVKEIIDDGCDCDLCCQLRDSIEALAATPEGR